MMDDAELLKRLRELADREVTSMPSGWEDAYTLYSYVADRIEALIAERDRFVERHERHLILGAEVRARAEKAEAERDAARGAALEEAAKVAENHAFELRPKAVKCRKRGDEMGEAVFDSAISEANSIAAAIRALKGKSQ